MWYMWESRFLETCSIDCNMARSVWALLPEELVEVLINIEEPDARCWLAEVINALSHEDLTVTVVTMWVVWHARRKRCMNRFSRVLYRPRVSSTGLSMICLC